jgi:hypothetical protein
MMDEGWAPCRPGFAPWRTPGIARSAGRHRGRHVGARAQGCGTLSLPPRPGATLALVPPRCPSPGLPLHQTLPVWAAPRQRQRPRMPVPSLGRLWAPLPLACPSLGVPSGTQRALLVPLAALRVPPLRETPRRCGRQRLPTSKALGRGRLGGLRLPNAPGPRAPHARNVGRLVAPGTPGAAVHAHRAAPRRRWPHRPSAGAAGATARCVLSQCGFQTPGHLACGIAPRFDGPGASKRPTVGEGSATPAGGPQRGPWRCPSEPCRGDRRAKQRRAGAA